MSSKATFVNPCLSFNASSKSSSSCSFVGFWSEVGLVGCSSCSSTTLVGSSVNFKHWISNHKFAQTQTHTNVLFHVVGNHLDLKSGSNVFVYFFVQSFVAKYVLSIELFFLVIIIYIF